MYVEKKIIDLRAQVTKYSLYLYQPYKVDIGHVLRQRGVHRSAAEARLTLAVIEVLYITSEDTSAGPAMGLKRTRCSPTSGNVSGVYTVPHSLCPSGGRVLAPALYWGLRLRTSRRIRAYFGLTGPALPSVNEPVRPSPCSETYTMFTHIGERVLG